MDVYEHVCLCAGGQMCARMCTLFGGQRLTSGLVFQELCTLFAGLSVRLGWLASELQDLHSPPPPIVDYKQEPHLAFYMGSGIMLV